MARLALTEAQLAVIEVSYSDSERLQLLIEQFIDDEQSGCRDPFDVIAELEELLGHPIFFS